MKILLTGGASDLAQVLAPQLLQDGQAVSRFDIRPPATTDTAGMYVAGSILNERALTAVMAGMDCVVHIAAWHGIHEVTGQKNVRDFWDLNVNGTFNVLETATWSRVPHFVYISSTSVEDRYGVYGHTKVLGEEMCRAYAARHGLNVIILRPRAFIPPWNTAVYATYTDWAKWFWGGAVHINDVAQAVRLSVMALQHQQFAEPPVLVVDGAYEYTAVDLETWDADGPGSTFRRVYPDMEALVLKHGLNPAQKPKVYDISETCQTLGYQPQYSLKNLLAELAEKG